MTFYQNANETRRGIRGAIFFRHLNALSWEALHFVLRLKNASSGLLAIDSSR